jgi:hypothetical protein
MTRRARYPTPYTVGPFRLVRLRRRSGFAIVDTRTGRYAYTKPSRATARPLPAMIPTAREALTIAASLA